MWILSSTPLGFQLREETRGGQFLQLPKTAKKIPPRENGFRPRAYKKRAAPRGCLFSRTLSGLSEHVWWLRGLQQVRRSRGGRWPVAGSEGHQHLQLRWVAGGHTCAGFFFGTHTAPPLCPSRSFHHSRVPDGGETGRVGERSVKDAFP